MTTTPDFPVRPRTLITAGPTQEPIDEVRYISNRSSGRMGMAIAVEAVRRGWPTTLLLGPVPGELPDCSGLVIARFRTTSELEARLAESWPDHDLLVMAAAVADHRPAAPASGKLRREGAPLRIDLEPTPDLLRGAARIARPDQLLLGFALEPADRLVKSAHDKLARKGIDAIVANPLETMDGQTVAGTLITAAGSTFEPSPGGSPLSKTAFAAWLLDMVPRLAAERRRSAPTSYE